MATKSIRKKLIRAILIVCAVFIVLIGGIVHYIFNKMGNDTVSVIHRISTNTIDPLEKLMVERTTTFFHKSAIDLAAYNNAYFEEIADLVTILGTQTEIVFNDNETPILANIPCYGKNDVPDDPLNASLCLTSKQADQKEMRYVNAETVQLDKVWKGIYANCPDVLCVFLYTESGILKVYPWYDPQKENFHPEKREWYEKAQEKGKCIWTKPYRSSDSGKVIITASIPFYNAGNQRIGVTGVDIELHNVLEVINRNDTFFQGDVFLIDSQGHDIVSLIDNDSKLPCSGVSFEALFADSDGDTSSILDQIAAGQNGVQTIEKSGKKYYLGYAPLQATGWVLGILVARNEALAPIIAAKNKVLKHEEEVVRDSEENFASLMYLGGVVFVISIIVALVISTKITRKIIDPILLLNKEVEKIGKGDLEYPIEINTDDEIADLADAFNKMKEDLKDHISRLKIAVAEQEHLESELSIAKKIQEGFLPKKFPPFPGRNDFDIYAVNKMAKEVGGDFYDYFLTDEHTLCISIGDVSGKGVPAALFMAIIKSLIKSLAVHGATPEQIMRSANRLICAENDTCMFATTFFMRIDLKSGKADIANCGHNPPLILTSKGDCQFLDVPTGAIIGIKPDSAIGCKTIYLKRGDHFLAYTDGVTEAVDHAEQLFGEDRLLSIFAQSLNNTPQQIVQLIQQEVDSFADGVEQADDITLLALSYTGYQADKLSSSATHVDALH